MKIIIDLEDSHTFDGKQYARISPIVDSHDHGGVKLLSAHPKSTRIKRFRKKKNAP